MLIHPQSSIQLLLRAVGIALIAFLVSTLCLFLLYRRGTDEMNQEVRYGLIQFARTAAVFVDGDLHKTFTSPEQAKNPSYQTAVAPLRKILEANPGIRFLYTMIQHDGKPCFVLDATPPGDVDHDGVEDHSPIMMPFETPAPDLMTALTSGKTGADAKPITDQWGTYLSGYAPFHDAQGNFSGIVGVDLRLDQYAARLADMGRALVFSLSVALVISLLIGIVVWWLGRRALKAEKKQIETDEAVRRSELRFRALLEQAPMAIEISRNGVNLYTNRKFQQLFGLGNDDDSIGRDVAEFFAPQCREESKDRVRRRTLELPVPSEFESVGVRTDGSQFPMHITVAPVHLSDGDASMAFVADITERTRAEAERGKLEAQLRQAQKMESVGRLAGGVAHDFNNMLGVILGHAEMARDKVGPSQPIQADLEEIQKAAKISANLTRQLLAFARKQHIMPKVLNLNDTVTNILTLLRRLIGEDVNLVWIPGAALRSVKLDPSQIEQILTNLCINAQDAITGGGAITIKTSNVTIDQTDCADHMEFVPGTYVMMTICDDGCGMEKEILANIYEPFYTTKGVGKGTGLGLATVYGIVKQNNGFIYVESEPGTGTTFRIYLPSFVEKTSESTVASTAAGPDGHGETVLLVEDEEALRETCGLFLELSGYKVLLAETPVIALNIAAQHKGDIRLILTDVIMPGMNGREMAEQLMASNPKLKVLFMSGYTSDVMASRGKLDKAMHFIQKPFTRNDLSSKVRMILDERD